MWLFKKNKLLLENITKCLDLCLKITDLFEKGLLSYIKNGPDAFFEKNLFEMIEIEKDTVKLMKKIESTLYKKSLLPESREDILNILEEIHAIVDQIKNTLIKIYYQNMKWPETLTEKTEEMIKENTRCVPLIKNMVRGYFLRKNDIKDLNNSVGAIERTVDLLLMETCKMLFENQKISLPLKVIHREIIHEICSVSDLCEKTAHLINIMHIKGDFS